MRVIDISLTLSPDLPSWPGHPPVELERWRKTADGASSNQSRLSLGVHSGTHVDAPVHYDVDARGTESLRVEDLIGPCFVLELDESVDRVGSELLEEANLPPSAARVLFKTRNSKMLAAGMTEFDPHFVALGEDAARLLVQRGTRVVGIDGPSIASYGQGAPTHKVLLQGGVIILEGLDLRAVTTGYYSLICLPLKLAGADGAPARAVLIDEV